MRSCSDCGHQGWNDHDAFCWIAEDIIADIEGDPPEWCPLRETKP